MDLSWVDLGVDWDWLLADIGIIMIEKLTILADFGGLWGFSDFVNAKK